MLRRPPRSPSGLLALLGPVALTLASAFPAAAEPPPEEDAPPPIPPAPDTLGGHFVLGAAPLLVVPFASLDSETAFTDAAGTGFGVGADVGYGLSRNVVAGAWFQYVAYGSADDCGLGSTAGAGCESKSFAGGAFLRYHLVQGTRYDPWAAVGIGYRQLQIDAEGDSLEYSGLEWLRLQVGGDWYPIAQIGIGPYAELDLGTFLEPPGGADASVYANFTLGLRVAFDAPGK